MRLMNDGKPLHVARSTLPPLEELISLLEEIWQSHIPSNDGTFRNEQLRVIETVERFVRNAA